LFFQFSNVAYQTNGGNLECIGLPVDNSDIPFSLATAREAAPEA
jgi:hypothetical protein